MLVRGGTTICTDALPLGGIIRAYAGGSDTRPMPTAAQDRAEPLARPTRAVAPRPTYGAEGPVMDTASRNPGPEPQEAATTRPKRATSDTPAPHREAAFGGAIVGAIAGEVTGAIVGGPPGAIVGGIVGAALGGIAAEKTVEGAPPGAQRPARPSTCGDE